MIDITIRIPDDDPVVGHLAPGVYVIGSGGDSHIQLDAEGISERHCRLVVSEEGVRVMDLGSKSGTFLDGERLGVSAKDVFPGDELRIGSITIEFPAVAPAPIDSMPIAVPEMIGSNSNIFNKIINIFWDHHIDIWINPRMFA